MNLTVFAPINTKEKVDALITHLLDQDRISISLNELRTEILCSIKKLTIQNYFIDRYSEVRKSLLPKQKLEDSRLKLEPKRRSKQSQDIIRKKPTGGSSPEKRAVKKKGKKKLKPRRLSGYEKKQLHRLEVLKGKPSKKSKDHEEWEAKKKKSFKPEESIGTKSSLWTYRG